MPQPNWPGSAGQPALAARGAFARKSLQLPFATGNGEVDAPELLWGTGSPEGVVVGKVGDIYIQEDGALGASLWQKYTGAATNTGWLTIQLSTGVTYPAVFAGATAGQKIQAAVTALAATGGVIDARGLASPIVLDVDIAAGLAAYNIKPLVVLWGDQEIRVAAKQTVRSHHTHVFHGATVISKNAAGARVTGTTQFQADNSTVSFGGPGNGVITTKGSAVVTKAAPGLAAWAALEVGSPLDVFGFVPPVGHDNTTINVGGGIDAVTASITVASTAGFPSSDYIRIQDEVIFYTSIDATHFLGCTRGYQGTTAAVHADTTAVERCVYQPFYVIAISGNNITLDAPIDFAATNAAVWLGVLDVSFIGRATFDGNKDPAVDDTANPYGIQLLGGRFCTIGPGLVFQHYDHGGYDLEHCQDSSVDAKHLDCGRIGSSLGAGGWLFGWNKRVDICADGVDCYLTIVVDDKSNTPTLRDGPAEHCTVVVRTSAGAPASPLEMSGCRRCFGAVLTATGLGATGRGISAEATQWITNNNPGPSGNVLMLGFVTGTAGFQGIAMDAGWANGNNVAISEMPGLVHVIQVGNYTRTVDSAWNEILAYGILAAGARFGGGTLAYAADEIRLTPTGRANGLKARHTGAGNYSIETTEGALNLGAPGNMSLSPGGGGKWIALSTGHFVTNSDNVYDIGAAGATRPRNLYLAGDIQEAAGGFRQSLDGWFQENVAASQTDVVMTRLATTTEAPAKWIAPRAGSVTGVWVKANTPRTAGTLTIKVFKNGVQLGTLTAVLDGTNTTFKATTLAKDTITFVAGDEIETTVTTDAGWLPVTADIRTGLEVET